MARVRGPYSAAFPVNFTSKGDTTRDAFKKHMDEIARIYGILTDFDKDIPNASSFTGQLTTHINSTNPHPNYNPSISWSNVTNKPGLNDLSGTLSASKVIGALTGATIASGNVTGLEAFVNSKMPASSGDGITAKSLGNTGYVKFANGLIVQWGKTANQYQYVDTQTEQSHTFGTQFPSQCFVVLCQTCRDSAIGASVDAMAHVVGQNKTGFKYIHQLFASGNTGGSVAWYLRYLAIGV